jgi:hypothetical protein
MTAAEAATAHKLARIVGSAIRAAGNPDDPGHAFASAFLGDLLEQTGKPSAPPTTGPAFDDDGYLNSGIVDPAASPEEQRAQLAAYLERQGFDAEQAQQTARRHYDESWAFHAKLIAAEADPIQLAAGPGWSPQVRTARDTIESIEGRIASGSMRTAEVGAAIGEAYDAYLRLGAVYDSRADLTPTVNDDRAASRLISLIADLGEIARAEGIALTGEQSQLVALAKGYEAQRHLPDIAGNHMGGGFLAARQLARRYGPTRPSGELGGMPTGQPETVLPNARPDTKRGIHLQNEAGKILASAGYKVEYLPQSNAAGQKNPDLLVEGRVFDVYSPEATTSAHNIVDRMASKVCSAQTERIVLNLTESSISRHELRAAFNSARTGIKEVIVIAPDQYRTSRWQWTTTFPSTRP